MALETRWAEMTDSEINLAAQRISDYGPDSEKLIREEWRRRGIPEATKVKHPTTATTIEWVKTLGPIVISWPVVSLAIVIIFNAPIFRLFDRFTESGGSKAELGPIKIELGNPV